MAEWISHTAIQYGLPKLNKESKMERKYLLWLLATLLVFGCTTHVDSLTKFRIEGEVKDQESGLPVQGAMLSFTDSGFDYVRSKHRTVQRVGQSNNTGKLGLKFDYFWGRNESVLAEKPSRTFTLTIEHPMYQSQEVHLRAADFPTVDNEIQVNLGIVKLATRNVSPAK